MELELHADPDDLTDLAALKPLAASRQGRPRNQSFSLVWHDTPDHALLDQGQTLAEQRGTWRLERVRPGTATWLPGQPPPLLEQAAAPALLKTELPTPLAPVAAFEGRRTITQHRLTTDAAEPGLVALTIERGVLRSVARERAAARVLLSGPDAEVRAAALMIAAAIPVSVPRASLAAEAIALARGGVPAPRHLGPPVLPDADLPVADALAHILGHLLDVILHFAPVAALPEPKPARKRAAAVPAAAIPAPAGAPVAHPAAEDAGPEAADRDATGRDPTGPDAGLATKAGAGDTPPHPAEASPSARMEAVHQMRVAVRRARSAVSVFRKVFPPGTFDTIYGGLKTLADALGPTRDWDVFVAETIPSVTALLPADPRMTRLTGAAVARRQACRQALSTYLTSPAFRLLAIELAWFVAATFWHAGARLHAAAHPAGEAADHPDAYAGAEPDGKPLLVRDFAPRVLQQRWRKLISAGKQMRDMDIASLHGVRLRAKRARYAAEMFAVQHQGKGSARFIRRLSVLQQRLGVLNDGAVAAELLLQLDGAQTRHAYAVGVVAGFTALRAGTIRPKILRAFEKFRRQPAYWT